jgi:hypothetical protein
MPGNRMRFCQTLFVLAVGFLGGIAYAQPPEPDAEERAAMDAREPYRGHRPFAVAILSPFNEPEWFVASFFHYWTGYTREGTAQEHWSVRFVSGEREYWDSDRQREIPGTPATRRWAATDTCPAFDRAIARFELHERASFTSRAEPNIDRSDDVVVLSSYDTTYLSFWTVLDGPGFGAEINLSTPYYGSSGIAAWVSETRSAIDDCLSATPPEMPEKSLLPAEPPFDIFGNAD